MLEEQRLILLLSTSDTDLLAAKSSEANYRCANPSRIGEAELTALLADVDLAVVRLLGGAATWPEGLATVLESGVATVVLGGESSPDAELMAASTVPSGVAQEALSYLVEGGPQNLGQLAAFL
ncbi:MAG: cobaltochelatase CobN, partial [Actinomycetota bacterium]|nr:cobaltochelatase CobN [Actinomycetota bacterium]